MRLLGPVLAGLLLLLPTVAASHQSSHPAQPMVVSVDNVRGLQNPLAGTATTNITLKLDCVAAQSDAPINFTTRNVPNWLYIRSMPGWRTFRNNFTGYSNLPCDPDTGLVTIREPMVMNFTSFAPAYRLTNFTVVATRGEDAKEDSGWVQPAYFGVLDVRAPEHVKRIGGQESVTTITFRVRNLGNGETTARIGIEVPEGVRFDAPEIMQVGAAPQGGAWDRALDVKLYLDEVRDDFRVTLNVTGFSRNATDPKPASGAEASATVDLQRGTPWPAAGLALAAAGAATLALGRRKGRA